jgi:thioredoxin reductase
VNLFIAAGILLLLLVVLCLLSLWQRKIAELRSERTVSEIQRARERGTDKALAQHPRIDVQACIGCGACIAACPEDGVLGLVDGVAHVIHGIRCIGHGRCAEVCPVAAVTVGLGDLANHPDIPILSESLETSVPGVFIAGELGGLALIRVAIEQAVKAIDAIAADLPQRGGRDPVDVLIVGAGPAGLAAALRAVERGLSYRCIDQEDIGGTVRKYPRRKLTLTGALSMPLYGPVKKREYIKEELIAFWEELIGRYRLRIETGVRFTGLSGAADGFAAETSAGRIAARRVLLALGRRGSPRKLGVPGEGMEHVLYQLIDAATYTESRLLVVGGGDSAVEAATALAEQRGNQVTLSYRRGDFFRLKARNDERIRRYVREGKVRVLFNSNVRAIADGTVDVATSDGGVEKGVRLANDYVFIFAGGDPPYPLLRGLGVKLGGDASDAHGERPQRLEAEA